MEHIESKQSLCRNLGLENFELLKQNLSTFTIHPKYLTESRDTSLYLISRKFNDISHHYRSSAVQLVRRLHTFSAFFTVTVLSLKDK